MAIQNLRDKLLKAGLVDKKQKVLADTQDRREKKQHGADKLAESEAEKRHLFEEKQAAEAHAKRLAEQTRNQQKAQQETAYRIRNICDRWAVRLTKPGVRRFYFVQRAARVGYLWLPESVCDDLCLGALAIVERVPPTETAARVVLRKPRSLLAQLVKKVKEGKMQFVTDETHVLLPPEPTERILALDAEAVRFWARSVKPLGYLTDKADVSENTEASAP